MNRISVGVDFSRESEIAIEHALAIARRSGAEVVLLHALPLIEPTLADSIATKYRKILIARQKEIRERLTEVLERHRGSGVAISHNLVDGPPAKVLAEAADELDSGLVVVGTHGRSGFNRFLLGSVAEKVVRSARSNVLVTRPSRRPGVYRRVLVPTDFSPAAERALEVAIGVAGDGAEVDVVHTGTFPPLFRRTTCRSRCTPRRSIRSRRTSSAQHACRANRCCATRGKRASRFSSTRSVARRHQTSSSEHPVTISS